MFLLIDGCPPHTIVHCDGHRVVNRPDRLRAALGNGEQSRRRSIALALARAETAERTREALAQQRVSDERL